eukprot:scaffold9017_cov66-Cyclotella_meneghiniana.AAC.2
MSTIPTDDGVKVNTRTDDTLGRTEDLFVCSYRLINVVNELTACSNALDNMNSSASKRKECHRTIRNVIIPVMTTVSSILIEAGKETAPIAGVKYICEKNERKTIQEVVLNNNSKKNQSTDLLMLKSYLSSKLESHQPPQAQKRPSPATPTPTPTNKRTRTNAVTPTTDEVCIRTPANGSQYTKQEVVDILKDFPQGRSAEKKRFIPFF